MTKKSFDTSAVATLLLFHVAGSVVPFVLANQFNYEVEKRVNDRISYYMMEAIETNLLLSNLRYSGAFPNKLRAPDRDQYLVVDNSLLAPLVYYGLEDGSISGFYKDDDFSYGYYREPGNSGFAVENGNASDPEMEKHLKSCIDKMDGTPIDCLMEPGDQYVRCIDDCTLEPCPDEDSQHDCNNIFNGKDAQILECEAKKKWCPQYDIVTYNQDDDSGEPSRGFLPLTNFCHDVRGLFTQEPNRIVKGYTPSTYDLASVVVTSDGSTRSSVHPLGNCTYGDGSLVQRTLSGNYAYCGGVECNGTFSGGYESAEYDPRYRPWYMETKKAQKPLWLEPYPFFTLGLGITATHPIYDSVDGKNVFAGVLSVDYRFDDIALFLQESYGDNIFPTTLVAVFEEKDPYNLIGLSTGTKPSILVLSEDQSKPCPVDSGDNVPCVPLRVGMENLVGTPEDEVLVRAFQEHKKANFPRELVVSKTDDSVDADIWISQSSIYEQPGTSLRWRIIIASPGDRSDSDSIEPGDPLFPVILSISFVGSAICVAFFFVFYSKRKERAVIYADWRFTCAFILGCAMFNASSLMLLGSNADEMCMARMWTYHLLYVTALSPLFVKIWRIWKLVGGENLHRETISHLNTALHMLPFILIQTVILIVISIVDPPVQTEETDINDSIVTQYIVCSHNTSALTISTLVYEGGLVVVGCFLAWQTRNVDKRFGESKQLIAVMYNIALITILFKVLLLVTDVDPNGESIVQAVGVFFVSVLSSAIFVIPRLIQIRKNSTSSGGRRSVTYVSGVNDPALPSSAPSATSGDSQIEA